MTADTHSVLSGLKPLSRLDHPREMIRQFTPNWFAATMGTGILALALAQVGRCYRRMGDGATAEWYLQQGLRKARTLCAPEACIELLCDLAELEPVRLGEGPHGGFGAGDHQVELGVGHLVRAGVEHVLAVDVAHARGADGAGERDAGDGQGGRAGQSEERRCAQGHG